MVQVPSLEDMLGDKLTALASEIIESPDFNKLNRLKKVNTEAFFYARRLEELG